MEVNIRQLYETHLKQLSLQEKLELMELLMQSTLDWVRGEGKSALVDEEEDKREPDAPDQEPYTDLQKQLLNGPVMAEEDYLLYREKKQHFASLYQ